MIEFIPAEVLKRQFNIFGHFYSVGIARREKLLCRSVLEIVSKSETPAQLAAISKMKPDAVFIMMNPGSSKPLTEVNNQVAANGIGELAISLVPTRPDTTQYQVMRVMHYCQWRHVRVLNLSDLRCTKSTLFFKQYQLLEETAKYDAHSIFSEARAEELASKLPKSKTMPVVLAWGVSPQLDPLIARCTARISGRQIVRGLLKEETTDKYFHPLPTLQKQKLQWVENMVKCCRGKA